MTVPNFNCPECDQIMRYVTTLDEEDEPIAQVFDLIDLYNCDDCSVMIEVYYPLPEDRGSKLE
jgi:hypothetical protein